MIATPGPSRAQEATPIPDVTVSAPANAGADGSVVDGYRASVADGYRVETIQNVGPFSDMELQ
ncbi:MAG: hypothetical protein L0H73_17460, partial [Nitrococcus sp.]|nr:hypothetical protein [Nitrococcus sp.]